MNKDLLDKVNKFCAEKCDIDAFERDGKLLFFSVENKTPEWTIEDARVREIVREKLNITTRYDIFTQSWYCGTQDFTRDDDCESIETAEIATIIQSYQASLKETRDE